MLLVAACAQSPEASKQKAFERGERFLKEGKSAEAIIELRAALAIDRDFLPALHALGRAYATKSWNQDAVRELMRARTLAPDSLPIAEDLGRSLLQIQAWRDAEEAAGKILSREPLHPGGLYIKAAALMGQGKVEATQQAIAAIPAASLTPEIESVRGEAFLRAGDVDRAEQAFRAALAGDPRSDRALVGLGRTSLARQDFQGALDFLRQAKEIQPNRSDIRLGLAEARARLGRTAEAIAELEGLDPHARSVPVQLSLARYYLMSNRASDAIPLLLPIVERVPQLPAARALLGHAFLATRKPDQAAAQFEALVRLVPDDPSFQLSLAGAMLQQGRAREALERLDAVARPLEKSAAYHVSRAGALHVLGRLDDAVRAAETARRLAPQDPQPYLIIGMIREQQGKTAAARDLFAQAAALNANYAPAHLALGQLHARERQLGPALVELDRAIEANPRSVVAIRAKAATLVRDRRAPEAVRFLEASIAKDPSNAELHALLGALHASERQPAKATEAFRKAVELDARALEPRLGLARLAIDKGNDKEAIVQLQAGAKEHPDHLTTVLLLTSLYEKLAQYDLAVGALEGALKTGAHPSALSLALAQIYLKQGRYDDVLTRTSDLVKQAPESPWPRLLRGQALLSKGDAPAAIKEISEATRRAPRWGFAHYLLARALAAAGRTTEARAAYRTATSLDPRLRAAGADVTAAAGKANPDEGGRFGRMQEVVKAEPGNLDAREELAREYVARGRPNEALAELKQVLERAPGRAPANLLAARILLEQNKPDEAVGYLRAALKSNPTLIDANLMLARYLLQRGRREEALTHAQAALRTNPSLGNLHPVFALLPESMAFAQELERREPKSPAPAALVGWILMAQQSPQSSTEAFRRASRIKPDFAEAHRGLAQALQATGQVDQAIDSYRQAVTLDGNDATSLNNLAWLLLEARKRPDEALPLASKAVELVSRAGSAGPGLPPPAAVLDTLGWVHYRRGAFADAERALARAAELAPKSAGIQFHLGATYSRLGKKTEAVAALRRAAELSPDLARAERIADRLKELGG